MVSYGLLCSGYDPATATNGSGCGLGVNTTIEPVAPLSYASPASVVHTRREVGDLAMADKIVMSHTKEYGSNRSYVTLEAHTGRSLWHSHALQTTAIDNFWAFGARFLGAQGKHDNEGSVGNHVVMRQAKQDTAGTPGFPFRNASDMFESGTGRFSKLFLPTHTHLPFLDAAGPLYLKRNFSVLGFSCDNWLNHTVNLTILPISLQGPAGVLSIDDFTAATAGLWTHSGSAATVKERASSSGSALRIVCAANATSCGPLAPKVLPSGGLCPIGCVSDGQWCQSVRPTFVNRAPSQTHPLPTERDAGNVLDVRAYEAFNVEWKMSGDYVSPPAGGPCFPLGVQTVDFAPQSNRTLSYYGNAVKQTSGCVGSSCSYRGVLGHPHTECLDDGEFWPIVNQRNTAANVRGEDLFSTIEVERGYFTSNSGTTRQIVALSEGALVIVDSLRPDANANGWVGGPSWDMSVGNDVQQLVHARAWPTYQERLNVTWRARGAFEFDGFAQVYNSGCTAGEGSAGSSGCAGRTPSAKRLLLVFPNCSSEEKVGLAVGGGPTDQGPLYFPLAASRTRVLQAGREEHFVSVLIPKEAQVDPATLANGTSTKMTGTTMEVTLQLPVVGRVVVTVQLGGDRKEDGWRVRRRPKQLAAALAPAVQATAGSAIPPAPPAPLFAHVFGSGMVLQREPLQARASPYSPLCVCVSCAGIEWRC